MWDPTVSGTELSLSPALASRFLTTEPPRKPLCSFYTLWFVLLNSFPLSCLSPLFFISVSLFLFCYIHLFYFSDFTYKWKHTVFVFLHWIHFTKLNPIQSHPCCYKWEVVILFYGWVTFHCTYMPHLSPFICWWILRLLSYFGYCK